MKLRRFSLWVAVGLLAAPLVQVTGATGTPLVGSEETYRGTLRIAVQYWGPRCPLRLTNNPLRLQKTRTFRMPVVFVRNERAAVGVVRERNPFNFTIATGPPLREAGINVVSGTVSNDPIRGHVLYEYWRSSLRGTSLTGRLVDSHRRSGIALNIFYTEKPVVPCRPELGMLGTFPETFNEGARLAGSVTSRRVVLTLKGSTFDRQRRFTARITAKR